MNGHAWAIVPAKSLTRGKSRLSPVLDGDARARFARELLEHVLGVLASCDLAGVLVATDGDDVAELARTRGAAVLLDAGEGTLAEVVDRALGDVASRGAGAAVVLMADLPRLEQGDVASLLAALERHDVALVRDHLGRHTNALAIAPPTAMKTRFGRADSFEAHLAAAREAGLRVAVVESERIAFDVDVPADHRRVTTSPPGAGT
ncbi:MAG TPA: 2-phospho-L-lactate guanylyltransferase [Polyangiaceae bacterium]|jgi:2-phospho-L-lactate guanylyltransferase